MSAEPSIDNLLVRLAVVPSLRGRARSLADARPADGSDAQVDQILPQGSVPQVLAAQIVDASTEHLLVWHLLLERGIFPRYAHLTLLRSALEPAVTARWLLAGPTSAARICRAVALLDEGDAQLRGIAASFATSYPDAVTGTLDDTTMAKIHADVDCARVPRRVSAPGKTSDRVRDFAAHPGVKSDWIYKVLSSPAHGNAISISMGEFGMLLPSKIPGTMRRRVRPSVKLALSASGVVVDTAASAISDLERYTGTDPGRSD